MVEAKPLVNYKESLAVVAGLRTKQPSPVAERSANPGSKLRLSPDLDSLLLILSPNKYSLIS